MRNFKFAEFRVRKCWIRIKLRNWSADRPRYEASELSVTICNVEDLVVVGLAYIASYYVQFQHFERWQTTVNKIMILKAINRLYWTPLFCRNLCYYLIRKRCYRSENRPMSCTEKFDMYRNLQPHRAVLPAIARHLVLFSHTLCMLDVAGYRNDGQRSFISFRLGNYSELWWKEVHRSDSRCCQKSESKWLTEWMQVHQSSLFKTVTCVAMNITWIMDARTINQSINQKIF